MGFLRRFSARQSLTAGFAMGLAVPTAWAGLLAGPAALPAQANMVLQETGTIYPAESVYTFEGTAGQTLTLTLESTDFDPVLTLLGPDESELAFNDDFCGSLNSQIIITLPEDGTYSVIARSFSDDGGDYDLVVRPATEFEVTFAEAEALTLAGDYAMAIDTYTEAIEIDPDQSPAYLGRAQAVLGQVYAEQGEAVSGPEDIPLEARALVIADFEQAAELFEASGSSDWALSLREQIDVLRGLDAPAEP